MTLPHGNNTLDERAQRAADFQRVVNEFVEVRRRDYKLFDNLFAPEIDRANNCRIFWANSYPKSMNESVPFGAQSINLRKRFVDFIYQAMRRFFVRSDKRPNPSRDRVG